jgi:MFS family permease
MLLLSLGINALAVLLLLAAPSAPRVDKPAAQATGTAELLRHLIVQRRSYAAILVGAMMTILLVQSISAWAPTLLVRRFALSVPQSGWTVGLIVMMTAPLGNLLGGAVLDRARSAPGVFLHRRIIALALVGVAFAGPLICLAPSPALAFAGLALTSVALGIATPVGLAGVQRLSPEALRGRIAAGFVAAVSLVSFGLGPLMVGWMSTRLFSGADSLSLALLLSITLSAAAGIAATLPRRAKAGAGR